jgi:hypothetical protein
MNFKRERGASAVKSVLVLLIIVLIVYVVLKLLPVKIDTYAFEDEMREIAKYQGFKTQAEAEIKEKLVRKANELELPVKPNDIQVQKTSGDLIIRADYTVDVNFLGLYVYHWDMNQKVSVPDLAKIR